MRYDENLPKKQGLYDPQFEHDSCGVGFVCQVKGQKSHSIVRQGLQILNRLSHRGAVGADPKTGDGAGILIQTPHEFFQKICLESKINLPNAGEYGTGLVFFPQDKKDREFCRKVIEKVILQEGKVLLGFRKVPVDSSVLGITARKTQPVIEQVFIAKRNYLLGPKDFERKLYIIRKQIENIIRKSKIKQKKFFYIPNLSSRTFSYKGLLTTDQVGSFFLDLKDESLKSALALVHSRYSTNTFPTWDLAQPFRFLAHNGEINTLRGNINWTRARERLLTSELFGEDIKKVKPILVEGKSDSAILDNLFELIVLSGRSLPHAMMMLIPGAWEKDEQIDKKQLDFYRYHACLTEPWDGPAAIAFTDGTNIGAILDRNGLRPARYLITKNDLVVMASEVGVLDIPPSEIAYSGRLEPGKIFFIDTKKGCIINDEEIKKEMAQRQPYGEWIEENLVRLKDLEPFGYSSTTLRDRAQGSKIAGAERSRGANTLALLKAFGYTREDQKIILKPMAEEGKEPIGSMGNDTPHAVLSSQPQLLYNYFRQLFAQVTNPPIDPIREKLVMSIECFIGPQENYLSEHPMHAHKLYIKHPILDDRDIEKIKNVNAKGFKCKTISMLFKANDPKDFKKALHRICQEAEKAIEEKFSFIVLSDQGVDQKKAALPALLAISALHNHLVNKGLRTKVGLILESAEPREVHHFALLFGYGADAINPYLAYAAVENMIQEKMLNVEISQALENYQEAINAGLLKILSKMGISTLRSYRGAHIFEALGLESKFVEKYFNGTSSRIGGAGLNIIAKETILRHQQGFQNTDSFLPTGGVYQWKKDGEFHLWNPETIAALQEAVRKNDYGKFKEFSKLINDQSKSPTTLRSLLKFRKVKPIPIGEVEPVEEIFKRLATGAMSFGSISRGAHETLALAMNKIGGKSNTGEGGEDPARFSDSRRSAIKQVASGRFGVTTNYLVNADELQIKIAQGAKPGEGGQLPGHKVSAIIAKTRYTTEGVTLISPPPHHDIYSIEDLAQLIFDLKNVNPRARISVKLVSEVGVGTIAAGVAKGHADMILISGGDGGTGASPLSSIRYAGLPWELGLAETHQTLVLNNLRSRVRLQTDGQIRTGKDAAIAALLGAEEYGFATICLIAMGCVMLRHCHLNNCSLGVATQDPILEKRFSGKPEYLVNYFYFLAQELRDIMASLGIKKIDDMIGRTDLLEVDEKILPWKAQDIDFSKILYKPKVAPEIKTHCVIAQDHNIGQVLDQKLIELAKPAFIKKEKVFAEIKIQNKDRSCGAMLSGAICQKFGEQGLPDDTVHFKFAGAAGQSFGAWLMQGVVFELEGMANDYIGKGISGGKIIAYPNKKSSYKTEENILIGNTSFYGAISGEAYINGLAGERFCIRNSGLIAVVEGVGDHGCEYMTGGRVVVLGKTGRNFAAGMSGGIAYVLDEEGNFKNKCNLDMVELEKINSEDEIFLRDLLHKHSQYTGSEKAKKILDKGFEKIVKVIPLEYKQVLEKEEVSDG